MTAYSRIKLLLFALAACLVWPCADALALSVEWKNLSGRERIIIRLDSSDGRIGSVIRDGATSISLPFSSGSKVFSMASPTTAKLFAGVEPAPSGLAVRLKTPEFGFILTRPSNGVVHLDLYQDALGRRWQPGGTQGRPVAADQEPVTTGTAVELPVVQEQAPAGQPQISAVPGPAGDPTNPSEVGYPPEDPSSVFSGRINPPADDGATDPETPPVAAEPVAPSAGPEISAPQIMPSDEAGSRLPEWPPLPMPETLPAPPPPPGGSAPAIAPQSSNSRLGGALNLKSTENFSRPFNWRELLPFASVAQAATADAEYETIQAPFAYHAPLNVNREDNWVERPIPVMVRVPRVTAQAINANSGQAAASSDTGPQAPGSGQAPALPPAQEGGQAYVDPLGPDTGAGLPPPPPQNPAEGQGAAPDQAAQPEPGASAPPASQPPSTSPSAQSPQAVPDPPVLAESSRPRVYVDEDGNPVEAPLVPATTLREVDLLVNDENYADAIKILNQLLLQHNLTPTQRETALHRKADAIFSMFDDDLAAHYQEVTDSSLAAINFNTRSLRNAPAYLRLGYTNLIAGNSYEAAGFFNVLRREYPNYENIALTYYYWGDFQYSQGNLNEAVDQFNYIVQNYPEHPISRDAALGLARSYYRMTYFDDAFNILLFVEQRWPSFYLDYPPMLSMLGDVAYRVNNLDKARSAYWMYYNLVPDAEDADMILTRLGDIYTAGKFNSAAVQVYTEAVERFPSKDGGVISLMRLAEGGIYDDPMVTDMFKVFERPYDQRPAEAYRSIIRDYPGSPLIPLAKLKLAMWMLWQGDYVTVLDLCSDVVAEAPDSPLTPRAREVAMSAFTLLAAEDKVDKRYARAREVWERYPILRSQEEFLDPESRLALAVSQWNNGFQDEALRTLEPFFYGSKIGEVSEMALFLNLNILTEHYRWEDIVDLASRVELWELTPPAAGQTDYALALAFENMDRAEAAAPLWSRIYEAKVLPPTQMANAAFYLARSAERSRDLESAYYVGQDALKLLMDVTVNDPEHADMEKVKSQLMSLMDISESSGILQQALDYAQQYMGYVNEGSLDQQSVTYRMARIHRKRGDTADWVRILEELSSKYPDTVYGKTAQSELASYRLGNEAARYSTMQ